MISVPSQEASRVEIAAPSAPPVPRIKAGLPITSEPPALVIPKLRPIMSVSHFEAEAHGRKSTVLAKFIGSIDDAICIALALAAGRAGRSSMHVRAVAKIPRRTAHMARSYDRNLLCVLCDSGRKVTLEEGLKQAASEMKKWALEVAEMEQLRNWIVLNFGSFSDLPLRVEGDPQFRKAMYSGRYAEAAARGNALLAEMEVEA
jgi:hypothetical protein